MGNAQTSTDSGGFLAAPSNGALSAINLSKKMHSVASLRPSLVKPLTKELTDKEVDFIANNSSLSRAEIEMWHQKFLVNDILKIL
jgi:hypothetical protein